MKPDSYFMPYAESAFNAYGDKAEWKTWDNKPMPRWDAVGDVVQARWIAAVKDVFRKLNVRNDADELFVPEGE